MASITKVFIANRGEIACRVARTAHRLGIATCGVYTPQDANSRHPCIVQQLAPLPAGDLSANYLNADLLISKAIRMGANAVHPGYGFLSENPQFAEKVAAMGLIWIGPSPASMRELGGKIEAKEVARRASVPVAPWMRMNDDPDAAEIERILNEIGLPALIKAAHGGGGRGQRVVHEKSQFVEALRAARSEAKRSFGSAEVFVERFLDRPRHIEVQILADEHGNVAALGERDCTLQRRNQKVIEEAPASVLDPETRERIQNAARSLAVAARYTNAGTVEFLAQKRSDGAWEFFFMELNARLQVEHPVTEEILGLDLVELQFRVACGENLQSQFASLGAPSGHAIELRLCAEDPANNFLPSPGPVMEFRVPRDVRVESGFEAGDVFPQEYDSLFAKLIVHAASRDECLARLREILDRTMVSGLLTNRSFLLRVLNHRDFMNNDVYTRWIESHPELADIKSDEVDRELAHWGRRISSELFVQRRALSELPSFQNDPVSSQQLLKAFYPDPLHGTHSAHGLVRLAGRFATPERETEVSGTITRFDLCVAFEREVAGVGQRKLNFAAQFEAADLHTQHGPVISQVPGLVLEVRAQEGDTIDAHMPVLVLEAMKIEMPISLPVQAKITTIHVKAGERVLPGHTLITWESVEQKA